MDDDDIKSVRITPKGVAVVMIHNETGLWINEIQEKYCLAYIDSDNVCTLLKENCSSHDHQDS